jgi:hypothetical protein
MHVDAQQAVALKNNLLADGLILHEDFEWQYCPTVSDGFAIDRPRQVIFDFKDPVLATFYQLKWV